LWLRGERLIAKTKRRSKIEHFAHETDCGSAYEKTEMKRCGVS